MDEKLQPHPDFAPDVKEVVVDVPGWQRVKPRIPDTPQRRELERSRSIREIVFGVQDGILTTLGIVTGVGVAQPNKSIVIVTGFIALLAGALSMAAGEFIGGKSEREVVQAAIDLERSEMEANPQAEFAEQVAYYKLKGFSADEAQMIVTRLTHHPDIYLYEMMRDEFGIDPREAESNGLRAPIAMGLSYAAGSLIPVLGFVLPLSPTLSTIVALALAVVGLFAVGFYAGTLTTRNNVQKAFEVVLLGCVVFVLSYLAGHYIPPLFGFSAVAAGG